MNDIVQKIANFIMWFVQLIKDLVASVSGKAQPAAETETSAE